MRSGTRLCEIVEQIDHIGPAHEPSGDVHDAGDPQRAVSRHIETTRHRSNPSQ